VDLSKVTVDNYLVAGIADHITPWQNCYQSTQLLGGPSRFILSTSGHIAALVNPPTNPKATFQVNKNTPTDPQEWLKTSETRSGSWWPDLVEWLQDREGADKPAPDELGGKGLRSLDKAPGTYVFDT
jgi:polyhydroxyalkanoate synthase